MTAGLVTRAAQALREGRVGEADSLCAEAVASGVEVVEALDLRTAIALRRGDRGGAVGFLEQALTFQPRNPALHFNLASILHKMERFEEACEHYRATLRQDPEAVGVLFELALALIDGKRGAEARPVLRAVIAAAPPVVDGYFQLGTIDLEQGHHRAALENYRRAIACDPLHVRSYINAALMYREEEQVAEAHRATSIALLLEPGDGVLYSNLAMFMKEQGDESRYRRLLEHAVAVAPGSAEFHYALAMSSPFRENDERLEGLTNLLDRTPDDDRPALTSLHFSLGKAYEDLGDRERSFHHQHRANAFRRSALTYDEPKVLGGFGRIAAAFTPDIVNADPAGGETSDAPIFVLGMPRSGSSLVEQILASHPRVFGAGELPVLATLINNRDDETGAAFPESALALTGEDYRDIGARYVEAVRRRSPEHERIVDKQTENFRLIGVIRRALPNARIIHTRRDPIDTCLSIYSKLFSSEMAFAYDLAEIGRYWKGYAGLMEHWRSVLPPGAMFEIDYEALVADQEGQTRRLLDYCGLEWHEGCLSFHQTRRVVRTASSQQVKRPMYKTSVGRWRPPEEALERLKQGLGQV